MPWEKSFDIDTAVDQALNVFWSKGYEATSLNDLLSATGIAKGSFYNAFGSKKEIFMQSLLKYDRDYRQAFLAELSALNNPVKAITLLFSGFIDRSLSDSEKKGCMLVNTAIDLPNHDQDTNRVVKKGLKEFENFFVEQLQLGKDDGSIDPKIKVEQTAKGLLTLVIGLRVLARGVYKKSDLQAIKSQALTLIQ